MTPIQEIAAATATMASAAPPESTYRTAAMQVRVEVPIARPITCARSCRRRSGTPSGREGGISVELSRVIRIVHVRDNHHRHSHVREFSQTVACEAQSHEGNE